MSIRTVLDELTPEQMVDRLSLALEGASLGIWDWDLRDDTVQFDRRWCELIGLDHASTAMHLDTWKTRVHPDDLELVYREIQATLEGRTNRYEKVHRLRHANGEWVYILTRGKVSGHDDQGRPIRFTGTHFDVTEVERARRLLEDQQRAVEETVRSLPAAVAIVDTQMRYLAASREWITGYGLDAQAIVGRSHYEIFPDIPERWKVLHQRALAGEALSEEEDPFERADGSTMWLRWALRPWRRAEGSIGGLFLMSEDVTDRVSQREREVVENRLASLGLVAGGIAHELNSPLQTIVLAADELRTSLDRGQIDPVDMQELVETIVNTTRRAAELTTALRAMARGDTDSAGISSVLLSSVLRDAGALARSRVVGKQLRYELVDRTPGSSVKGRASELTHVLLNLLNNACDAVLEKSGWVRLETEAVAGAIVVRCVDSGPGIEAKHQGRLMEPFFTTKGIGQGTGLGLSIAYNLARKNQGTLRYVPDAPTTTFELRLNPADTP
jgi:PAS domain S-box-containing protein